MGSGASILDPSHIRASTTRSKQEKTTSKTGSSDSKLIKSKSQEDVEPIQICPPNSGGELVNSTSEKFSIFEEPVVDYNAEIEEMERKIDERAARRLSRNIVSGEIQGNVLQAQFSFKSSASGTTQHNEYLLQKSALRESEGDKLHAKSLADLRKNMRQKLTHELQVPVQRTVSCVETLPSLQELRNKKTGLDAFTSMPNLAPFPPIGKPFPDKAAVNG